MIFRRGSGSLWRRLKLLLPVGRTSRTDHSIYKKHMNLPRFLLPLLLLGSAMPPAGATLALAPVFGANMVLQRGKPVPVSGTATANKAITVAFNLQTKATTADAAGNWQVTLDAMVANASGGNFTATEAGANTVTLANVVVGDVWICSGQSNMAFGLGGCNRQVDIDSANFPALRQFSAPLVTSDTALKTITGGWTACSPGTASGFSAVAFYFGRKICQDQSSAIPIGLFVSSVGGHPDRPVAGARRCGGHPGAGAAFQPEHPAVGAVRLVQRHGLSIFAAAGQGVGVVSGRKQRDHHPIGG